MILNKNQPKRQKPGANLNLADKKVFEAICKRAYDLYCRRGYQHGSDVADWLEAERQIKKEMGLNR